MSRRKARGAQPHPHDHPDIPTLTAAVAGPGTPASWSGALIRSLEWKRFEELCAGFFYIKGYEIRVTAPGSDSGLDFYLYNGDKDEPMGIVQCKAWNRSQIKVNHVRELYGIMADKRVPLGILVTTSQFDHGARKFAADKTMKLMTHEELLTQILSLTGPQQKSLLDRATWGDYTTPTCPVCDVKMQLRATESTGESRFWACAEYPKCAIRLPVNSSRAVAGPRPE